VLILLIPSIYAASVEYDDEWYENEGTDSDAAIWGGYNSDVYADDVDYYVDCVCWDWCDDGSDDDEGWRDWDQCDCESTQKRDDCKDYSTWVKAICDAGDCYINPDLEDDHSMDTGSNGDSWTCGIDIRGYLDCDDSSGEQGIVNWEGQDGRSYWIVYGHQYDCDSSPGPSTDPDYEGDYGSWVNIKSNTGRCSASEECDENHDEDISYSSTATPSDPCRTKNWYSCSDDDDCISDKCEQDECSTCSNDECTSAYWNSCTDNGDLCCSGDEVFGQYYCEYYETWVDCTDETHTGCQHKGDYYCTYEDGDWRWRECTYGCSGNSCTEPDIDVYPDPLVFNIGQ